MRHDKGYIMETERGMIRKKKEDTERSKSWNLEVLDKL